VVSTAQVRRRAPAVVVTAAGTITGDSVFNGRTMVRRSSWSTRAQDRRRSGPAGRLVPYDVGPIPSWRNLRYPRSAIRPTRRGASRRRGSVTDSWRLGRVTRRAYPSCAQCRSTSARSSPC